MKSINTLLLLLLMVGCSTPPAMTYVDRFRDTTIPKLDLKDVSVDEALNAVRTEWKKQTGTDMPVARVTKYVTDLDGRAFPVTFRAQYISFLDALRIIARISGSALSFSENGILITDILPYDYFSFQFQLGSETKAALGLGDKPSVSDVRKAFAARGADLSKNHLSISFLDAGAVGVCGPADDLRLAEAILTFSMRGYEIRKKRAAQQPPE